MNTMNENLVAVKAGMVAFGTTLGAFLGWRGVMLLAWVLVMAADYITGTAAACKNHEWSSAAARDGIWHKAGMVAVVAVSAIADWVMVIIAREIPIGIQWPGLIMPLLLSWYIVTELGSILENAVKMGAPVPSWLVKLLASSANIIEAAGGQAMDDEMQNE